MRDARGAGRRCRSTPNADLLHLVERLVHEEDGAFERRRRRESRLEREQQVVLRLVQVGIEDAVLVGADLVDSRRSRAPGSCGSHDRDRRPGSAAGGSTSPRARSSGIGNGTDERPPEMPKPLSSIFCRQRLDLGIHRVRIARRAPGFVHRHLEGVVLVQQCERAGRQVVLVLRGIRLRDRELRLVAGERIDVALGGGPARPGARTDRPTRRGSCRPCWPAFSAPIGVRSAPRRATFGVRDLR